jgi:hypothetical protein
MGSSSLVPCSTLNRQDYLERHVLKAYLVTCVALKMTNPGNWDFEGTRYFLSITQRPFHVPTRYDSVYDPDYVPVKLLEYRRYQSTTKPFEAIVSARCSANVWSGCTRVEDASRRCLELRIPINAQSCVFDLEHNCGR